MSADQPPRDPEITMISQPLLTEQGFLNSACMAELVATIGERPPAHERLSDDPEWTHKHIVSKRDIVGAFAMWACRQSPYGVPDGLENVCKYLNACLQTSVPWDTMGFAQASLCDINRWLHDILYEQGVKEFDAWNRCKVGATPDIQFASAFDGPRNPDRDFIDLDALLRNVALTIRDERRKDKAFDDDFERRHGKLPGNTHG